jgi:tRNA dimethylallyltransferase
LGPTATGKTRFAALLAHKLDAEIISADSRQVYRRMDLGTGKDYADYIVQGKEVPHHLVDIHEPGYKYNVYEFQKDFFEKYADIKNRHKEVILCGGTGMYIESVTKGYKLINVPVNQELRDSLANKTLAELEHKLSGYKKLHNRTDTDTIKRAIRAIEIEEYYAHHSIEEDSLPKLNPVVLGIDFTREIRRKRISERLQNRLDGGMLKEVGDLLESGIKPEDLIYYGLEYKFITLYLTGRLSFDEMQHKLNTAIHQFAKRQMTWFRKMEREGVKIHWINGLLNDSDKVEHALRIISGNIPK